MKTQLHTCLFLLACMLSPTLHCEASDLLIRDDSSFPAYRNERNTGPLPSAQVIPHLKRFDEFPINHNMHITSSETNYYTVNGGSFSSGQVNQFDHAGNLVQTFPIQIDGRGISYNKIDGFLYVSTYLGDIVRIDDLSLGTFTVVHPALMQDAQASFAISTDGSKIYDFFQGNLFIRDFATGAILDTITGLSYGAFNYGGNAAVAVNENNIFTWDAAIKTVYIYDMNGFFIQTLQLDSGDNGHSLSIAANLLWVSRDGNYATGTWYGYDLTNIGLAVPEPDHNELTVFPNPSTGKFYLNGNPASAIVYSVDGRILHEYDFNHPEPFIDMADQARGVYFVRVKTVEGYHIKKVILQ